MMVGVFGSYNMNFGLITCCILCVTSCDQVTVSAPPGKTMGHAGAIISGGGGKEKRLTGAGISLILTAECAEVRGEKQKRSANLCVLCGYRYHTHHIF